MSKKCQNCGAELADNMNFCPQCHQKFEQTPAARPAQTMRQTAPSVENPPTPKSKTKRILAGIGSVLGILFLVGFLVGRPYLNKKIDTLYVSELAKEFSCERTGFPKDRIRVRHVGNDSYEVSIAAVGTKDEKGRTEWLFEKAFVLHYRGDRTFAADPEEIKLWKFLAE